MKHIRLLASVGLGVATILLSMVTPAALAASSTAGTGQALEIAPPLITLSANPGQTIKAQVQLRDITSGPLIVTNQINDFVAEGEGGTPKILTGDDSSNPFSLKDWITPLPQFTLSPKQIHKLAITITVPQNASPGGHYGVIRFTGLPPDLNGSGVSLSASLGSLILLTVNGKLTHNLSVQEFSTNRNGKPAKLFESAPVDFVVRMKNTGNVQEEPGTRIIITDLFGKAVAGVNLNIPPHNILPGSIRKFTGTLDQKELGVKKLFGLYHATLTAVYGTNTNNKLTLTDAVTFWVIPYKLLAIALVLIIGGFFALRFLIKRYNEHIIGKAQKRPRRR